MAPSRTPTKTGDYAILPLTAPATPAFPHPTTHYLYVRPHAPKTPDADTPRSLFAVNLPIDATETSLRSLFAEQLGGSRVDRVEFEGIAPRKSAPVAAGSGTLNSGKKRKRGAVDPAANDIQLPSTWDREVLKSGAGAVVVFVDRASAEMAMKEVVRAAKKRVEVFWKGEAGLGVERYQTHHTLTFPDRRTLQKTINTYLANFQAIETLRAKNMARQRSVPDEDGFVTVTRGGRTGPARLEEAQAAAEKLKERQKPLEDFYRFQSREKRKENAEKLKRDFEQDRKRVEQMRARRGKVRPET